MNNPNSIQETQNQILELEQINQEKINQFSDLSMEISALIRQQKAYQHEFSNIKQAIKRMLVSEEDFDSKIHLLEEQLLHEITQEHQFKQLIAEKKKVFKEGAYIKSLQQSMSLEEIKLKNENSEKLRTFNSEKSMLLQQIEIYKENTQQLNQSNKNLHSENERLAQEISIEETELSENFYLLIINSFLHYNLSELQTIRQFTSQPDLFFALSYRLGMIYHLHHNSKQAFKYLSYLPSELLEWYQIKETYQQIKVSLLKSLSLIYSSQVIYRIAQKPESQTKREILLLLAIQAGDSEHEVHLDAHLNLLQDYLQQNQWLLAYLMIMKIRNLDIKSAKSCLPVSIILRAFSNANQAECSPSTLIKFDLMYNIMAKIPDLVNIQPYHTLELNESIPPLHRDIYLINHEQCNIEGHAPFLISWCQYLQGLKLIKAGLLDEALAQFRKIISEDPYFIEAYRKLAEYTQEPIWQHILQKR